MNTTDRVVARNAKFSPVRHYGAGVAPTRTAWLVSFDVIATGERRYCCASTHGHTTKKTAWACLARTIGRMMREGA